MPDIYNSFSQTYKILAEYVTPVICFKEMLDMGSLTQDDVEREIQCFMNTVMTLLEGGGIKVINHWKFVYYDGKLWIKAWLIHIIVNNWNTKCFESLLTTIYFFSLVNQSSIMDKHWGTYSLSGCWLSLVIVSSWVKCLE